MTPNAPYATSIAGWSFALARALEDYGLDSSAVFSQAGIDLAQVESPSSRLPVANVQKVWRHAYDNTDESFGIKVSEYLYPSSFHALGPAMYASSTFLELLERLVRYRCVVSHSFFSELLPRDGEYLFSAVDQREIKTNVTHDTMYSFIVRLGRQLLGPGFNPLRVLVSRKPRGPVTELTAFYGGTVTLDSTESAIVFARRDMEAPLPGGNPELAAKLDQLVEQYIAELGLISEYMLRVKTAIQGFLTEGEVNVNLVADSLNVTVRTLQRRLATENSSYNDVLDTVRQQLSMDYVKNPELSATEIAFRLGFTDSGSFSRSFKRWTGQSFSAYRSGQSSG